MALPPPARRWLILALCLVATVAQGAPEPATRQDEPDADLLDFLGAWQNEDGRWVDPFQLAEELPARAPTELKADRPRIQATNIGFAMVVTDPGIRDSLVVDGKNRWCTPGEAKALAKAGVVNGHTAAVLLATQ